MLEKKFLQNFLAGNINMIENNLNIEEVVSDFSSEEENSRSLSYDDLSNSINENNSDYDINNDYKHFNKYPNDPSNGKLTALEIQKYGPLQLIDYNYPEKTITG